MKISQLVVEVDRLFQKERSRLHPTNVNEVHERQLSLQDKVALWITGALGTMWAVYFFSIFMAVWMIWQSSAKTQAFDPYPFAFLLFLGNIVQLLLMPLIMVGQNIQGRHAELRAEESYKTTISNLQDTEHIMDHLVALDRELLLHREMLSKMMKALADDQECEGFNKAEGIHVSLNGKVDEH